MSNIQSVSASAPFSAQSLDVNQASSEEVDPRFVEELQGAMGQIEPEVTPQSAASEGSPQEADSPSSDTPPGLQNLPLMPWAMIHVPANFAPQEAVNTGATGDSLRVDTLTAATAVEASALQTTAIPTAAGLSTMPSAASGFSAPSTDRLTRDAAGVSGSDGTQGAIGPMAAGPTSPTSPTSEESSAPTVTQQAGISALDPAANQVGTAMTADAETQGARADVLLSTQAQQTSTPPAPANTTEGVTIATEVATALTPSTPASTSLATGSVPGGSMASSASVTVAQSSLPDLGLAATPLVATPGDASGIQARVSATEELAAPDRMSSQTSALPATVLTAASAQTQGDNAAQTPSLQAAAVTGGPETTTPLAPMIQDAVGRLSTSPDGNVPATTALSTATPSVASPTPATMVTSNVESRGPVTAAAVTAGQTGTSAASAPQHQSVDEALDRALLERSKSETASVPLDTAAADSTTSTAGASLASAPATSDVSQDDPSASPPFMAMSGAAATTGQVGFFQGNDDPAASLSVTPDAPAVSSGLALAAEPLGSSGYGVLARAGGSAESTFASSFVQALMGHVHPPLGAHSQALEVVPAPAPIAPHQVRFDAGQVQVEVVRLVKQGGGQVVMELTPPDESKFKIDLSISQQGVARLVVDGASESTRLRLEQTVSGLQEQFQQMGLQLQLDMRQPQQQHAQARPDASGAPDIPGMARPERSDALPLAPVSGRPTWEQSQVYLVA